MLKKLFIVLIAFALIIVGLQMFGGRDFGQMSLAVHKYKTEGTVGSFLTDVGSIFKGGKIKEGRLPMGGYADQVMYRWVDENGEVHVSERKPDVANYEEIRMGDLKFQVEDSLSKEELNKTLKKKDKDN
ncbi:MAG: DUF4124 domain-containing protein [Kangiellaceae bacterium]|nr:DUF4124 domain-containing protein [Kangiellaceae bacterium]